MQLSQAHDQELDDVEAVLSSLLDRARESVRVSTGLSTGIFNHDRPHQALMACLKRLPSVLPDGSRPFRVLLDGRVSDDTVSRYTDWLENPKVECVRANLPLIHMMIIDGNTFRIENPHIPEADKRSNTLVIEAPKSVAVTVVDSFDKRFAQARQSNARQRSRAVPPQPNGLVQGSGQIAKVCEPGRA